MTSSRIRYVALRARLMSPQDAAALIAPATTVGMSGFTGSGYPKAVPLALADRIEAAHAAGDPFSIRVWTGASTGPELDGALARARGIEFRLPYNSDPTARELINTGQMDYFDICRVILNSSQVHFTTRAACPGGARMLERSDQRSNEFSMTGPAKAQKGADRRNRFAPDQSPACNPAPSIQP